MMLMIERFMALAMSFVRMPPDAPTRAPEMMSTGLSSTNPAIAAAVPVKEFRREMTTGMSAPPIGRTMVTPKVSAAATTTSRTSAETVLSSVIVPAAPSTSTTSPRTAISARPAVSARPPGG